MVTHKLLFQLTEKDGLHTLLKLRLVHAWGSYGLKNPSYIFNYCTLWNDEEGTLIQGIAPAKLAQHFAPLLQIGNVYMISGVVVQPPSPTYRPCSHNLCIVLSYDTQITDVTASESTFWNDAFEFVSFASLHSRIRSTVFLTDVVGAVVSVTGISHGFTSFGSAIRREVVIQNESHLLLDITLWGEIARAVDGEELAHLGRSGPVVLGFGSLRVTGATKGRFSLYSTPGTRILLDPLSEMTHVIQSTFFAARNSVQYYPPRFPTPEDAVAFEADRTKTLEQLLALCDTLQPDSTRYHCSGQVVAIDSSSQWYYLGCGFCSKAAKPYIRPDLWCEEHRRLEPQQTQNCYRVRMTVVDDTSSAVFVLLGKAADALVGTTAPELSARFPFQRGHLPPDLLALENRTLEFDVQLPKTEYLARGQYEFSVLAVQEPEQVAPALPRLPPPSPQAKIVGSPLPSATRHGSFSSQDPASSSVHPIAPARFGASFVSDPSVASSPVMYARPRATANLSSPPLYPPHGTLDTSSEQEALELESAQLNLSPAKKKATPKKVPLKSLQINRAHWMPLLNKSQFNLSLLGLIFLQQKKKAAPEKVPLRSLQIRRGLHYMGRIFSKSNWILCLFGHCLKIHSINLLLMKNPFFVLNGEAVLPFPITRQFLMSLLKLRRLSSCLRSLNIADLFHTGIILLDLQMSLYLNIVISLMTLPCLRIVWTLRLLLLCSLLVFPLHLVCLRTPFKKLMLRSDQKEPEHRPGEQQSLPCRLPQTKKELLPLLAKKNLRSSCLLPEPLEW
ncbi:unnamed protein product [Linum tenue]|uniref:Replication protein A OB domain-containing protein n=1 Tax=Linum tenue TaxID=586396 RepID=A0AAV0PYM2_9ROSI|nr:unnamed protein product [Linum tenue]